MMGVGGREGCVDRSDGVNKDKIVTTWVGW